MMTLFLFARDHCDGHEAVADVGHFTAHHLQRDRGITFRSAREWALQMRVMVPVVMANGQVDGKRLPSSTKDYLKVAANSLGHAFFKKQAGMSLKIAHKSLCALADRLTENADKTWCLPPDRTKDEMAALKCVLSIIGPRKAFEPDVLVDGFLGVLKSCGLLSKEEIRQHRPRLSQLIQLFAVSVMHRTTVIMEDGSKLPIRAHPNVAEKKVMVVCDLEHPHENGTGWLISPIFVADLDPQEHLHPDLLIGHEIADDVELSATGKLVPL